jgi:antitoxin HicB
MKKTRTAQVGSSFDAFLVEEGIHLAVEARAIKRVITWQLREAMKRHKLTKALLARNMSTSRSELDRLLDPDNVSLTLKNLAKAATALGKRVRVEFVDASAARSRHAVL